MNGETPTEFTHETNSKMLQSSALDQSVLQTAHRDLFVLEPLADPARQIRLLRFVPSEPDSDNLHLSISTWDIDQWPEYQAISYTWGDLSPQRSLSIDGKRLDVGENCHYALWQARLHFPKSLIWLDSLCINQDDVAEKSVQVQMMGDIYANASLVLGCIGPHAEGSESIAELANELSNKVMQSYAIPPLEAPPNQNFGSRWRDWIVSQAVDKLVRMCQAHDKFVRRRYWTRVWIVQEIVKAKAVCLLLGEHRIDWQKMVSIDEILRVGCHRAKITELVPIIEDTPPTIGRLNGSRTGFRDPSLSFRYCSELGCADPRDRIFGILGFVGWDKKIAADYTKSAFTLALDVAELVDLQCVADTLSRLGVTAFEPQMREMIQKRRAKSLGKNQELLDKNGDFRNTGLGSQVCQIHKDHSGCLTAPFQKLEPLDILYQYASAVPCSSLQDVLTLAPSICQAGMPKQLMADGNVAALACSDTQAGDYLANVWGRFGRTDLFLVLRQGNHGTFSIVGQAFAMNSYYHKWKQDSSLQSAPAAYQSALFHRVQAETDITPEDMVVLAGQDILDQEKKIDWRLYVERLITQVSLNDASVRFDRNPF